MEWLARAADLILHLDRHLSHLTAACGGWTYLILFTVVFCETGLVVTPFLPGDSLLFAVGALAAKPEAGLRVEWLFVILVAAAVLGDTVNYRIGKITGQRAFTERSRWFRKEHLDRTHEFFERYGGKTIVIARFVPVVRTFAPFVAGIGSMTYARFLAYNVLGGVLWVATMLFAGYLFGGIPVVERNFSVVILAIIVISVLPAVVEYLRARRRPAGDLG